MHTRVTLRLSFLAAAIGMGFGAGHLASPPRSPLQAGTAAPDAALLSRQFRTIARQVAPSVVSVKVYGENRRNRTVVRQQGSGVILSRDGLLVTNNHVVMRAQRLGVVLSDGREVEGRVVGRDPDTDLALVRIDERGLATAELRTDDDGEPLEIGEWVLALGNPYGIGPTVTAGIISGLSRRDLQIATYEDFIQTDAAINPGNSGGPLVDLEGRVVGINTAGAMELDVSNGLGFAIPSSMVEEVVASLLAHGRVIRGYLGIQPATIEPDDARSAGLPDGAAVRVFHVVAESPAEAAGLMVGDVVLSIHGHLVHEPRDLFESIADLSPGSEVVVRVWRSGEVRDYPVTVAERTISDEAEAEAETD